MLLDIRISPVLTSKLTIYQPYQYLAMKMVRNSSVTCSQNVLPLDLRVLFSILPLDN